MISFVLSGALAGIFLGILFYVISQFWHFDVVALLVFCLGPPAVVGAVFIAETIHVGLTSTAQWSDGEREWLATAAGHHGRVVAIWALLTIVLFVGSHVIFSLQEEAGWFSRLFTLGTTGGIAGIVVVWLSKASATAATLRERYNTWKNWSASIVLTIATPVFVVIALSFLSAALDYLFVGRPLAFSVVGSHGANRTILDVYPLAESQLALDHIRRFLAGLLVCLVVLVIAAWFINTNRFSLHGLYRNRLIRAFLGGSRSPEERKPNPLSQFDENDNLNLCDLWPNRYDPLRGPIVQGSLRSDVMNWFHRNFLSSIVHSTFSNRRSLRGKSAKRFR